MKGDANSIHSGHRSRVRENVAKNGIYSLNDINYLEYLLMFVLPRVDTNPIAHALLARFLTLDDIFKTTEAELMQVEGVGPKTARFLHAVSASTFMRNRSKAGPKFKLNNSVNVKKFLDIVLLPSRNEQFIIINVGKNFIVKNYEIFEGVSHSLVNIDVKKFTDYIFAHQSGFIIYAHTHPEHNAVPSNSDDELMHRLGDFANSLDIGLIDNLIFGENDFFTYKHERRLNYDEYYVDYARQHIFPISQLLDEENRQKEAEKMIPPEPPQNEPYVSTLRPKIQDSQKNDTKKQNIAHSNLKKESAPTRDKDTKQNEAIKKLNERIEQAKRMMSSSNKSNINNHQITKPYEQITPKNENLDVLLDDDVIDF